MNAQSRGQKRDGTIYLSPEVMGMVDTKPTPEEIKTAEMRRIQQDKQREANLRWAQRTNNGARR